MPSSTNLRRLSAAFRAAVVVAVLAVGAGVFGMLVKTRPEPAHQERPEPVLTMRGMRATLVEAPRVWDGYGTASAMHAADVSAEVGARVIERPLEIEPGMPVARGGLIVRLESTDFEQALVSAEGRLGSLSALRDGLGTSEARWREQSALIEKELEIVRAELQRAIDARAQNAANVADVELRMTAVRRLEREAATIGQQIDDIPFRRAALDAQIREAQAAIVTARQNLARTSVVSPIDGVIQSVEVREGEMVSQGSLVARVVDLSRIEIPLRVPMAAAGELRAGDEVTARGDSPLSGRWDGTIARIAPEADPDSRTITLFAEVKQDVRGGEAGLLRPGQFVVGRVKSRGRMARLVVPRRAVDADHVMVGVEEPEAPGTFKVEKRRTTVLYALDARYPALDSEETQWVVVEGGVEPGELVVTSNLDELHAGQRVRIGAGRDSHGNESPGPDLEGQGGEARSP